MTISEREDADPLDDGDHFLVRQPSASLTKTRKISFGSLKDQIPGTGGGGTTVYSGTATLASGTVTVSAAWVTAGSIIVATPTSAPGVPGSTLYVSNLVASTSFDITSEDVTDTRNVFWHGVVPTGGEGFAMKCDGTASDSAFVTKDFGSDQSEVWVTFDVAFDSAALSYIESNQYTGELCEIRTVALDSRASFWGEPGLFGNNWAINRDGVGNTEFPDSFISANAWHTCEFHYKVSDVTELYIDGGSAMATAAGSSEVVRVILCGLIFGNSGDPAQILYIRNVKIGTTQGGTDLFADDFSGGDLSNWDSTTGTCTVVANPF